MRERTLNRLAEAIRDNGRRIVEEDVTVPQRAVVVENNPLQVELTQGRLVLDNEDLIVSQSVRRYHHDVGINVGDELLLVHVEGSEWVAAVVIGPGDTWPTGGGGSAPDATTTVKGILKLAGDLAGTADSPQIAAGVIVDGDVAAANKDGAAGTPSMRTLGTGAGQAAAGTHHTTHEPSGSDPMTVDAAVGIGSLRTLGAGAQQAMPGNRTLDVISAPAADVNLNSKKITNLANPTLTTDAVHKGYADAIASEERAISIKGPVKAASTGNLTLSGTQTVDGIALVAPDRVLVKDQTAPAENGIYFVQAGAWLRTQDAGSFALNCSAAVWVQQGTVNADTEWYCSADPGGTLGTTALPWAQIDQLAAKPVSDGGTGQTTAKAARETGLGAAGYYNNGAAHGAGTFISIPQATHGLRATRALIVQCQDLGGNVVQADVTVQLSGDVTVFFGASQAANSILVTIIG